MDSAIANARSAAVAVATAVDAAAELGALLEHWERSQRDGTEPLVSILSR